MRTRRSGAGRPRNDEDSPGQRTSLYLPNDLAEALDKYIESQDVRPTRNKVVSAALRDFLNKKAR